MFDYSRKPVKWQVGNFSMIPYHIRQIMRNFAPDL